MQNFARILGARQNKMICCTCTNASGSTAAAFTDVGFAASWLAKHLKPAAEHISTAETPAELKLALRLQDITVSSAGGHEAMIHAFNKFRPTRAIDVDFLSAAANATDEELDMARHWQARRHWLLACWIWGLL